MEMVTTLTNPVQLDDANYTEFRRRLLKTENYEKRQRQFLESVKNRESFLKNFRSIKREGDNEAELFPRSMTECEFKNPPLQTEIEMFSRWEGLTPEIGCKTVFWANLTLRHIEEELLEPSWLASRAKNVATGSERIDLALRGDNATGVNSIDGVVRAVLRNLGGLPEYRGNRSVYVDCPFARAWWRERMVRQAVECYNGNDCRETMDQIREVLTLNQTYWERLIDRIVCRNSTFGSNNIRGAFLRKLGRELRPEPMSDLNDELAKTKSLVRLCRRAAAIQGKIEMSILEVEELNHIMDSIVWDNSLQSSSKVTTVDG